MRDAYMILVLEDAWHVARVRLDTVEWQSIPINDEPAVDWLADSAREALERLEYDGRPILLGLGSQQCISVPQGLDSPLRSQRDAVQYELERWLPWSAEDFVFDLITYEKDRLYACAAPLKPLREIIDALDMRTIPVQSISPVALLAIEHTHLCDNADRIRHVLWQDGDHLHLFKRGKAGVAAWWCVSADGSILASTLRLLSLEATDPLLLDVVCMDDKLTEQLNSMSEIQVVFHEQIDMKDVAAQVAASVLIGDEPASVELRRGALAWRDRHRATNYLMRFAVAAIVLFMFSATVAFVIRVHKYQEATDLFRKRQETAFKNAIPTQANSIPPGIVARMQSELDRLKSVRGQSGALPNDPSALTLLHKLLSQLSEEVRLRILELRIEDGRLSLDGELRSHADADRIVNDLHRAGFEIPPPDTHRLPQRGVSFRVSGRFNSKPSQP